MSTIEEDKTIIIIFCRSYHNHQAMNTLQNFACAALLAANILTPATPQLIDFRLKGNRRHTTTRLQREARRAKIRKLVDAMSMPTIPIPDPPRPTPPPLTPVPFPSPGSPTDEPTATNSPSATQNAPTATDPTQNRSANNKSWM